MYVHMQQTGEEGEKARDQEIAQEKESLKHLKERERVSEWERGEGEERER
jgi:hypothetical protein